MKEEKETTTKRDNNYQQQKSKEQVEQKLSTKTLQNEEIFKINNKDINYVPFQTKKTSLSTLLKVYNTLLRYKIFFAFLVYSILEINE